MRECRLSTWKKNHSLYMNADNAVCMVRVFTGDGVGAGKLNFDAKSGGLRVGGLGGGGGLGSGLEQGFQDGLGVHLRSGLGGGTLAAGAGQGGGQAVLLWPTSCARIIT